MLDDAELITTTFVLEYWLVPDRCNAQQHIDETTSKIFAILMNSNSAASSLTDSSALDAFLKTHFLTRGITPTLASNALRHIVAEAKARA